MSRRYDIVQVTLHVMICILLRVNKLDTWQRSKFEKEENAIDT